MKRLILAAILFAIILLTTPHALAAKTFSAHVVEVVDGDTLKVNPREGGTIKIRLYGIDCPEKGQRYGKRPGGWRIGCLTGGWCSSNHLARDAMSEPPEMSYFQADKKP